MARPIKIFSDLAQGRIFFFGTRIRPAPLGGIVVAVEHPSAVHAGKIRVTRSDLFQKDGVTPRVIFKRLIPNRVKNQADQFLVGDLGFTTAQVIDYINDQANKKSNEIDIQKEGALVGGGTTLNFTGSIDNITVTDDVATISIDQIGVTTTGGYVGTGVTLFDFRGSGVSTVTPVTSGISTIFIEGNLASVNAANITGVITSGQIDSIDGSKITGLIDSTQLNPHITGLGGVNFTLGDSDTTPAFNLSDAHSYPYNQLVGIPSTHQTTINEFLWYQQYDNPGTGSSVTGPGITSTDPPINKNPYYFGTQLKPYQEMVWTHSMSGTGAYWIGRWKGDTTYNPSDAGNVTHWERSLAFRNSNADGHHIDHNGTTYDSTGFGFVGGGLGIYSQINNNVSTMRLRYNGDTNKLEIYRGSNTPIGIATANLAEDGNPITITAALSTNAILPGITTVQYYVDQTKWKYHNSNKSLENSIHDIDQGVVYWDEPLHRGEELMFSIPGNSCHVGVWNGGTGITGSADVRNKANWSTKWQYNNNRTDWEAATSTIGPTGVQMAKDIQVDNGTYAVRWDYNTNKLQLWEIDGAGDWLLSNANAALVGVTTQYIYFSRGGDDTGGGSLPSVTHRDQDFTLTSYTDATRPGPSFYDGTKVNDVWKSNRAFKAGLKLKFTVPTTAGNQYWATGFEGTEDLGNGENNAYQAGEMTWRLTNQERFTAHEDATMNSNYTAMDTATTSLSLPGRECSWRYNSNNTWDLFDEETDEVILTGDDVLSGDVYPYLLAVNNSEDVLSDYVQYEWEWNKAAWFMEYRDWDPSDNSNTWLILSANGHALQEATANLISSNGYYSIGSALYNVTWGEKMRPGQEFVWNQLAVNQNGATKNNMIIGVLDSTYSSYTCGIKFYRVGTVKEQAAQDAGFTLSAGISSATTTAGTSMRLQYEYGTNKLVCYSLNAGVRTKIAESTSALDGNPIFISMGGDSTRLPTTSGVEVYGWECAHQPPNYYNPWENWRIGGFPENSGVTVGIATTGQVLAHKADQVWRHKDGLPAGYKMHWQLPLSATNTRFGIWKTGNASSGLTNVENNPGMWDWSWRLNTAEAILDLDGMTFNTSNSNYNVSGPRWDDPNPGSTKFSVRYHSDNTLDIFDESNSEVIATKDAACDGNPIYISGGFGGATNNAQQMIDDFFGGGDVGIALTTTAV